MLNFTYYSIFLLINHLLCANSVESRRNSESEISNVKDEKDELVKRLQVLEGKMEEMAIAMPKTQKHEEYDAGGSFFFKKYYHPKDCTPSTYEQTLPITGLMDHISSISNIVRQSEGLIKPEDILHLIRKNFENQQETMRFAEEKKAKEAAERKENTDQFNFYDSDEQSNPKK